MPITAKHLKTVTISDFASHVTVGNSSGGSQTAEASDLVLPSDWNASHVLTFTPAASEMTNIFKANGGLQLKTDTNGLTYELAGANFFEPAPGAPLSTFTPGNQTWWFDPCMIPYEFYSGKILHMVSFGTGGSAPFGCTGTLTVTNAGCAERAATAWFRNAIYVLGSNGDTSRMSSVWSTEVSIVLSQRYTMTSVASTSRVSAGESLYLTYPSAYDATGGITYANLSAEGSSSTAASTMAASKFTTIASLVSLQNILTGGFVIRHPLASEIAAGDYRMAFQMATSSALGGTTNINSWPGSIINGLDPLCMANLDPNPQGFKMLGSTSGNSSSNFMQFKGYIATTSAAALATVATTDFRNTTNNPRFYWMYEKY